MLLQIQKKIGWDGDGEKEREREREREREINHSAQKSKNPIFILFSRRKKDHPLYSAYKSPGKSSFIEMVCPLQSQRTPARDPRCFPHGRRKAVQAL